MKRIMKEIFRTLLIRFRLPVLLVLLIPGLGSSAQAQDFTVDRYQVDVHIDASGYFDVVERYDITFNIQRHGIFRDILLDYKVEDPGGTFTSREIRVSHIEVKGHRYEVNNALSRKLQGKATIRIGDPDTWITGKQFYEIRYRVHHAFLYEENTTRFYWNLKAPDWNTEFHSMTFRIHLPEGVDPVDTRYFLYSGPMGDTGIATDFETKWDGEVLEGFTYSGFRSRRGESVTLLLDLPTGSVAEVKPAWPFWSAWGWTLIIILLLGGFYWLWKRYGEDDRVPETITYFPPENMDPAMAGFLINDREDVSDLISLIPYWGAKGYLEIEEVDHKSWFRKDDIIVRKKKDLPAEAPLYAHTLFNGLFKNRNEVAINSLKNSFYTTMNKGMKQLKKAAQVYYKPKSRKVRLFSGCIIILLLLVLTPLVFLFWGVVAAVSVALTCMALLLLNRFMINKSLMGNEVYTELKGFRRFIKTAEEPKLKMLLLEQPHYFEETMGYALTFGAFNEWAGKFEALHIAPPDWYAGSNQVQSFQGFSRSFSSSMRSMSSTLVSTPSSSGSSGGGSSGGGFGGGGGGSW